MRENDLANQVFGKLTALRATGVKRGQVVWLCQCSCGAQREIVAYLLRAGKTKSCGCLRRELGVQLGRASRKHGDSSNNGRGNVPEYQAWAQCIQRCTNQKHPQYPDYGGRGITVDPTWLGPEGYVSFLIDMGRRPSEKHSLDRRDNSKGYSPENCRWATLVVQNNNQRSTVWVTHEGQTRQLKEWLEIKQLNARTFYNRVEKGLTPQQALSKPLPLGGKRGRKKRAH
jgi:hypothetical protein